MSNVLSAAQMAEFDQKGFTYARGLFSPAEVKLLTRAMEEDPAVRDSILDRRDGEGRSTRIALWNRAGDSVYGLAARCNRMVDTSAELRDTLAAREVVPVTVVPFSQALDAAAWSTLIDARMRKRAVPERQRGMAPLTIGLGPNFVAGETVDLAIETMWGERLGAIVDAGSTLPICSTSSAALWPSNGGRNVSSS